MTVQNFQQRPFSGTSGASLSGARPSGFAVRRLAALILCVALVLPTAACLTPNSSRDDKLASGTIAGAAAGALIGYQLIGGGATGPWIAALVLGVAGGYAGYTVTDRLTLWDRQAMKETAYYSLTEAPAGETASWRNPDTGSNGTITPLRSYVDAEGRICRDYAATIYVEGENFDGQETACRNAVGAWVIG